VAASLDPLCAYYLGRSLRPDSRVLDVGCGRAAYRALAPGQYVGMDIQDRPFPTEDGRRFYVKAASDRLPFAAGSFDLVFARSAFYQFPDPDRSLAEFLNVLRPGGRLLLLDYNRRTQRRLEKGEGAPRPCWTQWQLRERVRKAGFRGAELLPATAGSVSGFERAIRLLHQELFGTWAIVTALK
jgi:SAM-dependent methyltransferase